MEKTDLPQITLTHQPTIAEGVFIARGAQVVGDVRIKSNASIWYNAVLRGDINKIEIGERTNIQDGCIVHLENDLPCIVGDDVTVGHGAILHGCIIEDACLIGMGAIILSGAIIKKGSIIGAGALVKENEIVAPNSLMVGMPAKCIRNVGEAGAQKNLKWAEKYAKLSQLHAQKGFSKAQ